MSTEGREDAYEKIAGALASLKESGESMDPVLEKRLATLLANRAARVKQVTPIAAPVGAAGVEGEGDWFMRGDIEPEVVEAMVEETGFPEAYCRLLAARGLTTAELIRGFFKPNVNQLRDPMLLDGMQVLMDELYKVYASSRKIAIHGDYDVDGLTSTALLARALSSMGFDVKTYVPHRSRDGYGVSTEALKEFAESGYTTVLTCDTGASAVEEIRYGVEELGLNILVTDHHPAVGNVPCTVMVNPNKPGDTYPFKGLCGAGVAFKVLQALCARLGFDEKEFIHPYLDLVAMGTICDVVPLVDENRILTRVGLAYARKTQNVGLREMLDNLGIPAAEMSEIKVGWDLGPRFNAAGRVSEPTIGLELLLADDRQEARRLVDVMEECNTQRRAFAAKAEVDAMEIAAARVAQYPGRRCLVLAPKPNGEQWHQGILSTVAPRIVSQYGRAVVLVSQDPATGVIRGSGRIVKNSGARLNEAIASISQYFSHQGGHAQACGVTLKPECLTQLEEIEAHLDKALEAQQVKADGGSIAPVHIDADLDFDNIDDTTYKLLAQCAPFGPQNEAPTFRARGVELVSANVIGKKGTGVKLRVRQNGAEKELIGWDKVNESQALLGAASGSKIDVAYQIKQQRGRGGAAVYELHYVGARLVPAIKR